MGGHKTPGRGRVSGHSFAGISPGTQQGPRREGLQTISVAPVPWVEKRCWEMAVMRVTAAAEVTAGLSLVGAPPPAPYPCWR